MSGFNMPPGVSPRDIPGQDDDEADMQAAAVLTLRDYFAAKAMQAILGHLQHGIRPQDCIVMAEDAYTVADAMLKARRA